MEDPRATPAAFGARAAAAVAAATLRRPTALLALALLVVNDHVLKARWPGLLTGKVSDLAWPLVAVPLGALVLAPLAGHLDRRRWATLATVAAAAPFVAVNLSPAAARAAADVLGVLVGPSAVTVDPTDLLVVPMFVLPLTWLRTAPVPDPRPPGALSALQLTLLGLAALGTAATSCLDGRPRVERLAVTADGDLLALVAGEDRLPRIARSEDAGLSWEPVDGASTSWDREPDPAFARLLRTLRAGEPRTEVCTEAACYTVGPSPDQLEVDSDGRTEALALADPRRELPRRRELAHVCTARPDPHTSDLLVVPTDEGERVVVARSLEGVVLIDGDEVRPVPVLDTSPADQRGATAAVVAPETAGSTVIAVLAWFAASVVWWRELRRLASQRGVDPDRRWPAAVVVVLGTLAALASLLPAVFLLGDAGAVTLASATVGASIAVAWLTVRVPRGWRHVPWFVALWVTLPWLAANLAFRAWAAGWPRSYVGMVVLALVAAAGAFEAARRIAPLPPLGGPDTDAPAVAGSDGPPPPPPGQDRPG